MIMRPAVLHPYRPTYTSGEATLLARLLGMTQASPSRGRELGKHEVQGAGARRGSRDTFFLHMVTKDRKAHLLMWHCGERV